MSLHSRISPKEFSLGYLLNISDNQVEYQFVKLAISSHLLAILYKIHNEKSTSSTHLASAIGASSIAYNLVLLDTIEGSMIRRYSNILTREDDTASSVDTDMRISGHLIYLKIAEYVYLFDLNINHFYTITISELPMHFYLTVDSLVIHNSKSLCYLSYSDIHSCIKPSSTNIALSQSQFRLIEHLTTPVASIASVSGIYCWISNGTLTVCKDSEVHSHSFGEQDDTHATISIYLTEYTASNDIRVCVIRNYTIHMFKGLSLVPQYITTVYASGVPFHNELKLVSPHSMVNNQYVSLSVVNGTISLEMITITAGHIIDQPVVEVQHQTLSKVTKLISILSFDSAQSYDSKLHYSFHLAHDKCILSPVSVQFKSLVIDITIQLPDMRRISVDIKQVEFIYVQFAAVFKSGHTTQLASHRAAAEDEIQWFEVVLNTINDHFDMFLNRLHLFRAVISSMQCKEQLLLSESGDSVSNTELVSSHLQRRLSSIIETMTLFNTFILLDISDINSTICTLFNTIYNSFKNSSNQSGYLHRVFDQITQPVAYIENTVDSLDDCCNVTDFFLHYLSVSAETTIRQYILGLCKLSNKSDNAIYSQLEWTFLYYIHYMANKPNLLTDKIMDYRVINASNVFANVQLVADNFSMYNELLLLDLPFSPPYIDISMHCLSYILSKYINNTASSDTSTINSIDMKLLDNMAVYAKVIVNNVDVLLHNVARSSIQHKVVLKLILFCYLSKDYSLLYRLYDSRVHSDNINDLVCKWIVIASIRDCSIAPIEHLLSSIRTKCHELSRCKTDRAEFTNSGMNMLPFIGINKYFIMAIDNPALFSKLETPVYKVMALYIVFLTQFKEIGKAKEAVEKLSLQYMKTNVSSKIKQSHIHEFYLTLKEVAANPFG